MSASAPPQQEPTIAAAAASAISSAFPAPPPFYKSFTPTNIALLAARQNSDSSHPPPESILSAVEGEEAVVGDLAHLVPPLPPQDGKYRSFGILHDVRFLISSCAFQSPSPNQPAYKILTRLRWGSADLHESGNLISTNPPISSTPAIHHAVYTSHISLTSALSSG